MKNKIFYKIFIFYIIIFGVFWINIELSLAATCIEKYPDGACSGACNLEEAIDSDTTLCPDPQVCCHTTAARFDVELNVPIFSFTRISSFAIYIKTIYQTALYIIIPLLVVIIIYGGALWLSSGFDESQKGKAKEHIKHGFIGLGIVLLSYILLSLVGIQDLNELAIDYVMPGAAEDGPELIDIEDYMKPDSAYASDVNGNIQSKGTACYAAEFGAASVPSSCQAGSQLTTVSCAVIGNGARFQFHKKAVAALQKACNEAAAAGSKSHRFGGSYNCRFNVNSPGSPSPHAFGIAFDLDPTYNQNCKSGGGTCTPGGSITCRGQNKEGYNAAKSQYGINGNLCLHARDFGCTCNIDPKFIDALLRNGFKWGAFRTTFDAMHFEWVGPCAK